MQQLKLFDDDRLPAKPYCVDWLGEFSRIRPLATALRYRYLQFNPPHSSYWIVVDIDRPIYSIVGRMLDGEIPLANYVVINPDNHHAHAFYALAVPVKVGGEASLKALQYLAAIEAAIVRATSADPFYAGLLAKNPTHPDWVLRELRTVPYSLGELQDALDLQGKSKRELRDDAKKHGLGRNCSLFDDLRLHAYQWVSEYRDANDLGAWQRYLQDRAEAYNTGSPPLDVREVAGIVKSVANWTWKKYTGRGDSPALRARQAELGRHSAASRKAQAGSEEAFALQMGAIRAKRPDLGEPWVALGISRATYFRRQKRAADVRLDEPSGELFSAQSSETLRTIR